MDEILRPATEWELKSMIGALAERQIPVEIIGAGSKRSIGRPISTPIALTTAAMRGVSLYEPSELVMSAKSSPSDLSGSFGATRRSTPSSLIARFPA